ncbi:MAG TPA: lamin tail domain-containing protein [Candidatus Sulfomarinibacteraceae bacterium]|nr:lamin tail domain-containing protein [Candidatus Sulfomarinibacteraceae bacterium]
MSLRRMLPFILINIVVSATVVLLVLYWWDNRQPEPEAASVAGGATEFETAVPAVPGFDPPADEVDDEVDNEEPGGEEEEDGPTIHIVQAGETLGRISQMYDVSMEDIATANDIIDVNSLAVGQELMIPIGGLPNPTETPTPEPTAEATPTPEPTEALDEGEAIVEITEVIGAGDLTAEAVRISNVGNRPLMLRGWELADEDGHVYTFVDVTLYGGSETGSPSILVHTETGQNGPSDLYWGLETEVWESGETVTLRDAEGTVQATYDIP